MERVTFPSDLDVSAIYKASDELTEVRMVDVKLGAFDQTDNALAFVEKYSAQWATEFSKGRDGDQNSISTLTFKLLPKRHWAPEVEI